MPPSAWLHSWRLTFGTVILTAPEQRRVRSLRWLPSSIRVIGPILLLENSTVICLRQFGFPTVLLPGQGIAWEAIDNTTARAKLSHAVISVSLEFQFGKDGEIVRVHTPQRCREIKGAYVPTAWTCYYRNYAKVRGIMVPMEGETEWIYQRGGCPTCESGFLASNMEPAS